MLTRREFSKSVPQVSWGTLASASLVPPQALFNYSDQSWSPAYDLMTAARERGILFDVAHGTFHFGFDLTEKCPQQGFLPDSISTDLAGRSVKTSAPVEITILELREGTFELVDAGGIKRKGTRQLFSAAAIRDGKLFDGTKRNNISVHNSKCSPSSESSIRDLSTLNQIMEPLP